MGRSILGLALVFCALPANAFDDAQFVAEDPVPEGLTVGNSLNVKVAMRNTGTEPWSRAGGYKLGAQSPQDNSEWGASRVEFGPGEVIAPGQTKTFAVPMAPQQPGLQLFHWRMVREHVGWFGQSTPGTLVGVLGPAPGPYLYGGSNKALTPSVRSSDKTLFAHYFYWYDDQKPVHIGEGEKYLTYKPPSVQQISWRSVAGQEKQMRDMAAAGITFADAVYWGFPNPGPGNQTDEWSQLNEWSNGGLKVLVQALKNLDAKGIPHPLIAMFWDTTTLLHNPWIRCDTQDPNCKGLDLTLGANKHLAYGIVRDFYSQIPPQYRAAIDGKLVVITYSSNWAGNYGPDIFAYIKDAFKQEFPGQDLYIIRDLSWDDLHRQLAPSDNCTAWGGALVGPRFIPRCSTVSIGPGFKTWSGSGPSRERNNGRTYWDDWSKAIQSGLPIVEIETWSEYHEGTVIAQTQEFGDHYIALTAELSQLYWRGNRNDASFVRQSVPTSLAPGEQATVSVTMRNSGRTMFTDQAWYHLGSQGPQDGLTWGLNRVPLNPEQAAGYVRPGQEHTFTFTITAPKEPGNYDFQWQLVEDATQWFGEQTPRVVIAVKSSGANRPAPAAVQSPSQSSYATPVSASRVASSSVSASRVRASLVAPSPILAPRISSPQINAMTVSASQIRANAVNPWSGFRDAPSSNGSGRSQ